MTHGVFVCDDDEGLRFLVRTVLEEDPRLAVTGGSGDPEACAAAARGDVDAIVTDLSIPGADGLEVLARLRAAAPGAAIVVYSGLPDPALPEAARRAGADAFVSKREDPVVVRQTLLRCLDGKSRRP